MGLNGIGPLDFKRHTGASSPVHQSHAPGQLGGALAAEKTAQFPVSEWGKGLGAPQGDSFSLSAVKGPGGAATMAQEPVNPANSTENPAQLTAASLQGQPGQNPSVFADKQQTPGVSGTEGAGQSSQRNPFQTSASNPGQGQAPQALEPSQGTKPSKGMVSAEPGSSKPFQNNVGDALAQVPHPILNDLARSGVKIQTQPFATT